MLMFHAKLHKGLKGHELLRAVRQRRDIPVYGYIDGIAPSKSGMDKMYMVCIHVPCCRAVLNLAVIKHEKDHEVCADDLVIGLIEELTANPYVKMTLLVADLPERCRLSGTINFNGADGCITCIAKGQSREGGRGGYVYPFWTSKQPHRDDDSFKNLGAVAEATGEVVAGVKQTSILFRIPGFSIVNGLAVDPMHLLAGLTKYFWEQLSKRALAPSQVTALQDAVNDKYISFVVPKEFKRDTRKIAIAQFKWNEWKQLLTLCGLDIAAEFEIRGFTVPALIWRILTFTVRAMSQGQEWYEHANPGGHLIAALIDKMYASVEDFLGTDSCTANLHNYSHLELWRKR